MRHTNGREDIRIKVVTDPKKLMWLRVEIQKAKQAPTEAVRRKDQTSGNAGCRSRYVRFI